MQSSATMLTECLHGCYYIPAVDEQQRVLPSRNGIEGNLGRAVRSGQGIADLEVTDERGLVGIEQLDAKVFRIGRGVGLPVECVGVVRHPIIVRRGRRDDECRCGDDKGDGRSGCCCDESAHHRGGG